MTKHIATLLRDAGAVLGLSHGRETALRFQDAKAEYDALTAGVGFVDLSGRSLLELTGDDRAAFLHNLCTNDIRRLTPGQGCEAFLTNVQGKILAHIFVFCGRGSLVVDSVAGQSEKIAGSLDRYLIREKVEIADRSQDWAEILLAGACAEAFLANQTDSPIPPELLAHQDAAVAGHAVAIGRVDLTGGPGFLLRGEADAVAKVWLTLREAGAVPCGAEALEMARIEAATPWYGVDISEQNLPQEVARDERTISFTKGCYLGQETVARIDALGHVNRTLCLVKFPGAEIPAEGCELSSGEKPAGHVTSAAYSPGLDAPLALAYVRRGHNTPGAKLQSPLGEAEVVEPPAGAL